MERAVCCWQAQKAGARQRLGWAKAEAKVGNGAQEVEKLIAEHPKYKAPEGRVKSGLRVRDSQKTDT